MNTIKIKDKERPIKFGIWAIKKFAELEGKRFDDVLKDLEKLNTEQIIRLIYCGFLYGAKVENLEIDFDEENVWFWLDEDVDLLNEIMEIFTQSMPQRSESKNLKAPQRGGK